jgi:hypothetical protein
MIVLDSLPSLSASYPLNKRLPSPNPKTKTKVITSKTGI